MLMSVNYSVSMSKIYDQLLLHKFELTQYVLFKVTVPIFVSRLKFDVLEDFIR